MLLITVLLILKLIATCHALTDPNRGLFIFFKNSAVVDFHREAGFQSRAHRRELVYRQLTLNQAKLYGEFLNKNFLSNPEFHDLEMEIFWMLPCIYVSPESALAVHRHLSHSNEPLELIWNDPVANTLPIEDIDTDKLNQAESYHENWALESIQAQQAWNISTGTGIRVAIIDTGVEYRHESLLKNYAGTLSVEDHRYQHDYNWFDPLEFRHDPWWCDQDDVQLDQGNECRPRECCLDEPFDNVGHGTHVMGSFVGSMESGIGVAPGAQWMAAKGCRDGNCLRYGLLASAQWVICPTPIQKPSFSMVKWTGMEDDNRISKHGKRGNWISMRTLQSFVTDSLKTTFREPELLLEEYIVHRFSSDITGVNCSLGADIISNSWGSKNPSDRFLEALVRVWREAGSIPVFAAGNAGPDCGAMSAPGDFKNVMGVGSLTVDGQLAKYSARGPGPVREGEDSDVFSREKPDFVLPGSKIRSASSRGLNIYTLMSGTSMATPHLSGVIALILSAAERRHPNSKLHPLQFQSDEAAVARKSPVSLSYDQVYSILKASASIDGLSEPIEGGGRSLPLPGWPVRKQCAKRDWTTLPNPFYGWGKVNALKAVKIAASMSG